MNDAERDGQADPRPGSGPEARAGRAGESGAAAGQPDGGPGGGPGGRRPRKPAGRRPGGADTRGAVLDAARSEFAACGYDATSIRAVARAAGVDSALVHHYFGTKQQLFLAALDFPLDPQVLAEQVIAGDPATVGERTARFAFTLWEQPGVRDRLVATLRAAAGSEQIARMMSGFFAQAIVPAVAGRLAPAADGTDPRLRAELAFSQIIGVAMARYVFAVPPLSTAGVDELVAAIAPTLQRYLGGQGLGG